MKKGCFYLQIAISDGTSVCFFYSPFSEQKESVFAMKSALDKASVKLNIIAHILQMKAVEG